MQVAFSKEYNDTNINHYDFFLEDFKKFLDKKISKNGVTFEDIQNDGVMTIVFSWKENEK